jgi:hypothetical protein
LRGVITEAIAWGNASDYATKLKAEGFAEIADQLVVYSDEPPF